MEELNIFRDEEERVLPTLEVSAVDQVAILWWHSNRVGGCAVGRLVIEQSSELEYSVGGVQGALERC